MKPMRPITVFLLMLVLTFSGFALAQEVQKETKMDHPKGECPHSQCASLQLTEEQQKKIDELKLALDKELLPLKADLKVKKAELEKLLLAEKPSKTTVEKKIDEIGALRIQIHKALVNHRLAVRELLTPEQRVKFDRMPHPGCKMEKGMRILKRKNPPMPPHRMEGLGPGAYLEEEPPLEEE